MTPNPHLERLAVKFSPEWKGPIEGYVVNSMRQHYFRVEATMERDDYVQEAYLVFLRVKRTYAGKVTEPQHFMALFKRAWSNKLNDLSNSDTRHRETFVSDHAERDGGNDRDFSQEHAGETDNEGTLAILIRQAPRDVSMVLNLFLSAPQEILEVALESWRGRDKRCKAGGSERICKLLGLDPSNDVMQRVEDYFASNC